MQQPKFTEYPKVMMHPNYQAPALSGDSRGPAGAFKPDQFQAPPSSPKFPPVIVNSAAQEGEYAARGYVPQGASSGDAYYKAFTGQQPTTKAKVEYPKWKYHPSEAPVIVQNEREERALKGRWFDNPGAALDALEEAAGPVANADAPSAAAEAPAKKTRPRAKRKKARTPAQIAATERMLAARAANIDKRRAA
ncbi:MAG TPA: hypothetical protein VGM15_03245 [Burkholderiaceae bacterium]|jgi:hypothetical protein